MSPSVPILLAATTLLAQAPRAPEPTPSPGVEALAWMAGAWRTTGPVTFEEHWMAPRGGLMVGMGRTVAKGRAVAFEFLRIETKEGRTAYLASPGGRPATRFELTRATADEAVFENLAHDFNIGSVVRTANAFNAASVRVVGRRRWNRRGAMVTDRYLHVEHHDDSRALAAWAAAEELPLIGVDNLPGSVPLETFDLPRACVLLFGQEGSGLSDGARDACDATVSITQYGSTRSINVGAAAAIAMHAWVRRHSFGQWPVATAGT